MVSRRKVIVVDLDGTLVKVNTFPKWILHVLISSLLNLDFNTFHKFFLLLALRKLGFISHHDFKFRLIDVGSDDSYNITFAKKIIRHINPNVIRKLGSNGVSYVLSTAAPSCYAHKIAELCDVNWYAVYCSEIRDGKFFENYGKNKVDCLVSDLGKVECLEFYTDHHEDLPMMQYSNSVTLVEPSMKTIEIAEQSNIRLLNII
ncbi:haloacid dehalogenase-like hydrolase [Ferrimonas balearica]|uniref:HAD family hydrolase n=1 Tax=Ferrimonas balearica TaxID=44012 RepID=UPI001C98C041|nr:haloacid dehalogenase-like hydrolase [Ferrimonas balearica]